MSRSEAERIRLFGTVEPPPEVRLLTAGELSVELESGNLRYIRWGGIEVLRGIAYLVRDTKWGTYSPEIADLEIEEGASGFHVTYEARCSGAEGAFRYSAEITGKSSGELEFRATGAALSDFPANRVGFVILHPLAGVAGAEVDLEHTDGSQERLTLPELVAPDQPAFDLRVISHQPAPGLRVRVVMEGDAFEMEDHRNWTDASFKTYVRPLSKPKPFTTPAGETLVQSVQLSVQESSAGAAAHSDGPVAVTISAAQGTMPAIALACDGDGIDDASRAATLLRDAGIRHLSARYDPGRGHGVEELAAFEALRAETGARLTLEAIIPGKQPDDELRQLAADIGAAKLELSALLPSPRRDLKTRPTNTLPAGEASIGTIQQAARPAFPGVTIGAGVVTNFTEFNRNPPPPGSGDFVSHSTCAIVHAADDRSVMETLQSLPFIFASIRSLVGSAARYRIGLAGIGTDGNPYGPAPTPNPNNVRVPMTGSDPRQRGQFAAAFALAYTVVAVNHGIAEIVLGHVGGPLGVIDTGEASPPGVTPRPVFDVVAALARAEGRVSRRVETSSPAVLGFAFEGEAGIELWLVNTTGEPVAVAVPDGFREATQSRGREVTLAAYGMLRLTAAAA